MRVAWFSPLPPTRSGIAAYSAEVLELLHSSHAIDVFVDRTFPASGLPCPVRDAHDFIWQHRLDPYDLVVYQLGNAPCHDYMWAYLARFPGLVVLHDTRLHHARARSLLSQRRIDDYRAEFRYDHPDAPPDVVEYSVSGLGGSMSYFWSMLRVVTGTARTIAVHNERVADELRAEYPDATVEVIRMGVGAPPATPDAEGHWRTRVRRELALPDEAVVFAAFGKVTAEKRIASILRALGTIRAEGADVFLLLVGDADEYGLLPDDLARLGISDRVRVTGYVPDEAVHAYLSAADVCLCLRWPTAAETSASWLRCLASSRPTVVSDLAHLADVPTLDASTWQPRRIAATPVAVSVDVIEEEASLAAAMRRLASDRELAGQLGRAGHAFWTAHHTLQTMASDYLRVMQSAAARPAPRVRDLPAHFTDDYTEPARRVARRLGVAVDLLER